MGGFRLFERLESREVGALHLAHKEGSDAALMWWVDAASIPEIASTWNDVVRALRTIQSPNVLAVRGAGEQGPLRWMTFTYVPSETLGWIIQRVHDQRGSVPWEIACRIVADAARGVEALHACRDGARAPWPLHGALSGESFSVTFDGRTVLIDPGRLFPLQGASQAALAYSAPERVWSEPSDGRADVFGLGVLLWELCAGRRLFLGRDEDETRALLEAHVVPELQKRVRGAPPALDDLIARALARVPGDRVESPAALAKEIEALFSISGATTAEVAKYMRSAFADRDRLHRARAVAATEVTEIRVPGSEPRPLPPAPTAPDAEEATLTHEVPSPLSGSDSSIANLSSSDLADSSTAAPTVARPLAPARPIESERDDATRPHVRTSLVAEALRATGETRRVSLDADTRSLPVASGPPPRAARPRTPESRDDPELETLPRITNIDAQLAVVLEPADLETDASIEKTRARAPATTSVDSDTLDPSTRRREDTATNIETAVQETRVRQPPEEDTSATRVRPETRPRRGGMDVGRGSSSMPAARPPTPGEAFRGGPLPPPPRPPRRASESSFRSAEPAGAFVRPPPPAPPPPRPQRTPPPPAAAIASPLASPLAAMPAPFAGAPPFGANAQPLPSFGTSSPNGQPSFGPPAGVGPQVPSPYPAAPQPAGFAVASPGPPAFASPAPAYAVPAPFPPPQQRPAPHTAAMMAAPSLDSTSDSSVSFGPIAPPPNTVLNEPAEKVIVGEARPPMAAFVSPAAASEPMAPAPAMVAAFPGPPTAPPSAVPPPPPAEPVPAAPLLLPRDPNMPAMQRALLARDAAARESDRRIALPVVVVAFVVAIGVAIGIPLLAHRPTQIAPVPPASATPSVAVPIPPPLPPSITSGTPGATPFPPATGPIIGNAPPALPPTGVVPNAPPTVPPPPPLTGTVPSLSASSLPESPTRTPRERTARVPSPPPVAPRPRRPDPGSTTVRPRIPDAPQDEPRDPPPRETASREPPSSSKGLLTVICNPPCDDVVDGTRSLGPSPVFKASVSAGPHRLTLRISDPPQEKVVSVTVAPDETTVLTQPMSR